MVTDGKNVHNDKEWTFFCFNYSKTQQCPLTNQKQ